MIVSLSDKHYPHHQHAPRKSETLPSELKTATLPSRAPRRSCQASLSA